MSSLHDEFEDSRTSGVGRKRDLEDLTPRQDTPVVSSDEDDNPRSRKRTKKDHEPLGDSGTDDGPMLDGHSPRGDSHSALDQHEKSRTSEPDQPILTQSSQPTSWNKSIQTGLRTSFGSKVHVKPPLQTPVSVLQDDGAEMSSSLSEARGISTEDGDVDMPFQAEDTQGIPPTNPSQPLEDIEGESEVMLQQESDEVADVPQPAYSDESGDDANDSDSDTEYQPAGNSNGPGRSVRPGASTFELLEDLKDHPQSAAGIPKPNILGRGRNIESDAATTTPPQVRPKKPLLDGSEPIYPKNISDLPKERLCYTNGEGTFKLSQVLKGGHPISLQDITFQDFKPHFLKSNSKAAKQLKPKAFKGAFGAYVALYYGHVGPTLRQQALATVSASVAVTKELPTQKAKGKQAEPKTGTAESTKGISTGDIANASQNAGTVTQKSNALVDTGHDADVAMDEEHDDLQDSRTTDEEPTDAMDIEITEMELALQQKYFPTVAGFPVASRCLVCADNEHKTIDCPALSCTLCSGNHSTFTCPQNQRCSKCRQKGHPSNECPEKLLASKSELDRCELCNSTGHFEIDCHRIWRSFAPKAEDIRKVHSIPIHCYLCGASGHYGPECGLQRGKILSGGVTWSQANLQVYLDSNSSNRVISAGVDYSIPQRKVFTIKGKANDPITLDDSDDDVAFIRPKVNNNTNARPNGSIRIEQNSRAVQPPPYPRDDYANHSRNLPRQAAPNFGPDRRFQDESMRYGRERTFSPPPAFRDDIHGMQLPYRQDSYHPLPPRPQEPPQTFTFAAQPTTGDQSGGGRRRGHRPKRGGGVGHGNIRTHRGSPAPIANSAVAKKPRKKKPKKAAAARGGKSAG